MLAPVAFVVFHINTAVLPAVMLEGAAENELITGGTGVGTGRVPPAAPTVSQTVDLVEPYLLLAVRI